MQNNVIQRRNMKLKYKLFLAFTILFTITTFVLHIINYHTSDINDVPPTDFDTLVLIFVFLSYVLIMCNCFLCINSDNIYNYETLQVRESASI